MSYRCCAFVSILLWFSVVGCKEQKAESGADAVKRLQVARADQERSSQADSEADIVLLSTSASVQSNERFDSVLLDRVRELTGKEIASGVTTRDASGNPSETKFADGSKILYSSNRMHQFIDANGKITPYNYGEKNLLLSSVDSDGGIEQFIYDKDGNMISKRDKDGHIIPFRKSGQEK